MPIHTFLVTLDIKFNHTWSNRATAQLAAAALTAAALDINVIVVGRVELI